jgi:astacin
MPRRLLTSLLLCSLPLAATAKTLPGEGDSPEANSPLGATQTMQVYNSRSANWTAVRYSLDEGRALVEGDIVVGESQDQAARGFARGTTGGHWPNGLVPYQIDASISSGATRQRIADAIAHWEEHTPLRFVARSQSDAAEHPHYLNFVTSSGCSSHVGRIGGQQRVWIGNACSTGNVIHEIGHAIGLYHEHTRPDRDGHLQVNWENIRDGKSHNFEQQLYGGEQLGAYDFGSIMHYGAYFFSRNGKPTLQTLNADAAPIGQRFALSAGDVASVNRMYGTDLSSVVNAASSTARPGNAIELHLQASNLGSIDAREVTLRVPLPQGSELLQAGDQNWLCIEAGELVCSLAELPSYASQQLVVQLSAPALGGELNLYAAIDSDAYDFNSDNDIDHTSVQIDAPLEAPQIHPGQRFSVSDQAPVESEIGQISASDPLGGEISDFAIVSGDDAGAFSIDPSSGVIRLRDPLALIQHHGDSFALGISASSGITAAAVTLVQINIERSYASNPTWRDESGGGALGPLLLMLLAGARRLRKA